jgi:hypothetical protein
MLEESAKPFAVPAAAMATPAMAVGFGPALAMSVTPPITVMMVVAVAVAVALEEFQSHVFISSVSISMYRNIRYI